MLKGGSVPIKLVVIFFLLAVKHLVEKKYSINIYS